MATTDVSNTPSLLLEIGVEELPSSYVEAALTALPALFEAKLANLRLPHGEVKAYGTPRRLAVTVSGLAAGQSDVDEEVVGPPEGAAYKDGVPTKAAEAFAQKLGCTVDALSVVAKDAAGKQKAGRYVVGRRIEKGKAARDLLGAAIAEIIPSIPFRKSMRWGSLDVTFGRPVQWLVALLDGEVVDTSFAGIKSGNVTRGHRFLSPAPFAVKDAGTYVEQLRAAHVLVDRDERTRTMMERVTSAAVEAGGTHDPDPNLVVENASLVEEPHVVLGSFEKEFLALPASVIRAVARGHQKYFCVHKAGETDDVLLPHYLTVANTANDPAKVAKGNDRVMRARLADARFFFEEDKKAKLDSRVEKLEGIVFHVRLGTVREKVVRLEKLARFIAPKVNADPVMSERAARLCKSDLVSLMVGEFPELQGQMGYAYALGAGEPKEVALAIRDHYAPLGASDDVAKPGVSAVIALADRFDTLVGCFAVGLSPTGSADPYALRRACIAALRTLMDIGATKDPAYARLSWDELVRAAYAGFEGKKLDLSLEDTVKKIEEFAAERFRGLLAAKTSPAVAEAVLGGYAYVEAKRSSVVSYPAYALWKAQGLHAALGKLQNARTVAKRLSGISKTAKPIFHRIEAFDSDREKNQVFVDLVTKIDGFTQDLESTKHVAEAIENTPAVVDKLEEIFVKTLVNDPNDPLTPKRLELLSYGAECMLRIADFSRLG